MAGAQPRGLVPSRRRTPEPGVARTPSAVYPHRARGAPRGGAALTGFGVGASRSRGLEEPGRRQGAQAGGRSGSAQPPARTHAHCAGRHPRRADKAAGRRLSPSPSPGPASPGRHRRLCPAAQGRAGGREGRREGVCPAQRGGGG